MYSLRTFGTLVLERDGSVVEPLSAQRKALAVLTVLATDGTVTRDRLMALLWPESDMDRARGSLKQAIHTLRQLIDPDLVLGRADLSLNPALIDSDVGQFQRALQDGRKSDAVALYRGEFLDGVHLNGSAEIEQWVEARRTGLAAGYRGALETLAREAQARGDAAGAVRWWTVRAGHDPLDGKAALHLMEALEASGQRAAAIQHFQAHEEALQQELGLAPDAPLVALAERLRRAAPAQPGIHREKPVARALPVEPITAAGVRVNRRSRIRGGFLAIAALLVAAVVIAGSRRPPASTAAFNENLLAVAPFDVLDPSLDLWREGMVDVLSEDLDGAGPLHTVAQSVVVRRWRSSAADRGSADELGRSTGAGLVVYGQVGRRGTDSVSIRATLLDRAPGAGNLELLEVAGPESRMGELVDSLGVKILRTLGRGRPIGSVRHVSIGSRSLPALKEFLLAEQFYRQGEFDSALAHYDRAIAEDTTFALALRRMAWTMGSGAATAWRYDTQREYFRRAANANHGLSPRDSLLLLGDSLVQVARSTTGEEFIANVYRVLRIAEELVERYRDDPEIWYELGERLHHFPLPLGGSPGPTLAAFDRAIELDSGFAPAYMHTLELAVQLGDLDRARRYARLYRKLTSTDPAGPAIHLAGLIFDSGGVHAPVVRKQLETAGVSTLVWTGFDHFNWLVDSAETPVILLRELVNGEHDPGGSRGFAADPVTWPQALAAALIFRGHLREAYETNRTMLDNEGASRLGSRTDRFYDLAFWGILPDSLVRRTYDQAFRSDAPWDRRPSPDPPRFLRGVNWWYAKRDTTALARFIQRAGEIERQPPGPIASLRARYFGLAARGYLSLARGDSMAAIEIFTAIPDTLCLVGECFNEKLTLSRLLTARGEHRAAGEILDRWWQAGGITSLAIVAALERAQIAEQLGDRARASERYQFVLDAWRSPDPELRSFVDRARAGLARTGKPGD